MNKSIATTEEYLKGFPAETKQVLGEIRNAIKKIAPSAAEGISYGIPTFFLDEKPLIYFAGYKSHVSIYPAPREHPDFSEELKQYKGGKGTVQFPLSEAIPMKVVNRIVKFRLAEHKKLIAAKLKTKKDK